MTAMAAFGTSVGLCVGYYMKTIQHRGEAAYSRNHYHSKITFFEDKLLESFRKGNLRGALSQQEVAVLLDYTAGFCKELKDI